MVGQKPCLRKWSGTDVFVGVKVRKYKMARG